MPEEGLEPRTHAAGNPTLIQAANDDPTPVRYSYDSTNLVASITDQKDRTTTFTYNKKGLRRKTSYPNGVVMENRYDHSERLACTYAYTGTAPTAESPGDEESWPSPSTSLLTYYRYAYEKLGVDTDRREKTTERDGSVTLTTTTPSRDWRLRRPSMPPGRSPRASTATSTTPRATSRASRSPAPSPRMRRARRPTTSMEPCAGPHPATTRVRAAARRRLARPATAAVPTAA